MSQAASQWATFARDVAAHGKVWTVKDSGGFPAPLTSSGKRAQPFWSSLSRVKKIISTVPAYAGFDGLLIGVNWSGPRAAGYDVTSQEVLTRIQHEQSKEAKTNA